MMCQICQNWASTGVRPFVPNQRGRNNIPLFPNHHEGCPHYEDSLIDVWQVSFDGQSYYSKTEPTKEETESGETVTKTKMHLEVFEQLPEFGGF